MEKARFPCDGAQGASDQFHPVIVTKGTERDLWRGSFGATTVDSYELVLGTSRASQRKKSYACRRT